MQYLIALEMTFAECSGVAGGDGRHGGATSFFKPFKIKVPLALVGQL